MGVEVPPLAYYKLGPSGEAGRRTGLEGNLSTQLETIDVNLLKVGEPLTGKADGNPEPSLKEEGVETRREDPKDLI